MGLHDGANPIGLWVFDSPRRSDGIDFLGKRINPTALRQAPEGRLPMSSRY